VPQEFPTDRSLNRPASETRDVSNRRLPLERTYCTRTSRIPGSLSRLASGGLSAESLAPRSLTGGTNVSRRSNRFSGFHRTRFPLCGASRAEIVADLVHGHGRFLPMVPDETEPLTSLSLPTLSFGLTRLRACSLFRGSTCDLLDRLRVPWVSEPPRPRSTPFRKKRRFLRSGMPSIGKDPS
jgi:hypothetical protein